MPEHTLTSTAPFGGYSRDFSGVSLNELDDLAIVSVATPHGGEKRLAAALKSAYWAALPKPGKSALAKGGKVRILGLSQDQFFLLFQTTDADPEKAVQEKLKGTGYTTDQTHIWAALTISGVKARVALERICPIDLHPEVFSEGALARTTMEHMGAVILRTKADEFLLLSASSSAGSFLHAVETSITNVL